MAGQRLTEYLFTPAPPSAPKVVQHQAIVALACPILAHDALFSDVVSVDQHRFAPARAFPALARFVLEVHGNFQ
jgi:hypothetical protein